jgi:hypothetical protein
MTVRRPAADGNTDGPNSELSVFGTGRGLLTLRSAVILSGSLIVGVATGVLMYLVARNLAVSVLAGVPACAGAIKFLDTLID